MLSFPASYARKFWEWYNRSYRAQLRIAAFLFGLQIVHLAWLTAFVVAPKILGEPIRIGSAPVFEFLVVVVDYLEVPAIITTSLVYSASFARERKKKDVLYLVLLNVQWLHILWITDEVVLEAFARGAHSFVWHPVIAWLAIMIDYLELPVIFETIKRAIQVKIAELPRQT